MIVFDVFEPKPPAQMTEFDRYVDGIVLGSMSVTEKNQWIGDTLDSLKKSGFSGVSVADLTTEIQPSLERLERYSEKWFSHAKARQFFRRLISEQASGNSIAGWLMPLCFDGKELLQYNRITASRNSSEDVRPG